MIYLVELLKCNAYLDQATDCEHRYIIHFPCAITYRLSVTLVEPGESQWRSVSFWSFGTPFDPPVNKLMYDIPCEDLFARVTLESARDLHFQRLWANM